MDNIINAIQSAFSLLKQNDGLLFQCPQEIAADYDQRKLHEVCINHKLAIYLEKFLFPEFNPALHPLFTDIEFNREGINFKELEYDGQEKRVRPDIIIHNRKTGEDKKNILIVECKKDTANPVDFKTDTLKIEAFLVDPKYSYDFGLQVLYSKHGVTGTFYFKENGGITSVSI